MANTVKCPKCGSDKVETEHLPELRKVRCHCYECDHNWSFGSLSKDTPNDRR